MFRRDSTKWALLALCLFVNSLSAEEEAPKDENDEVGDKPLSIIDEVHKFRGDLEALETYSGLMSAEAEAAFDPRESKRYPKILSLRDVRDFSFDGDKDPDGLPDGNGTLTSDDETGQVEFCLRKSCYRAVKLVYGTFRNGLMQGQAWVVYQDGGIMVAAVRDSVFHGVYKVKNIVDGFYQVFFIVLLQKFILAAAAVISFVVAAAVAFVVVVAVAVVDGAAVALDAGAGGAAADRPSSTCGW